MSLPISTIKAALYEWLTESTGLPVIWMHQNAPEPNGDYIAVNPALMTRRIGLDDEQIPDPDDELVQIAAHRKTTASIHAFGSGAFAALTHAYDALEFPTLYQAWFEDRDLGAYATSDVRNLPTQKNGRYEQHAQLDLVVTCLNTATNGDPLTDDPGFADAIQFDAPSLGFTDPITIPAP